VTHGVIQCDACRTPELNGLHLPISCGTLQAMRYILASEPKKIFSFTLGEDSLKELCGICEAYLLTRLERGFYTLDFYKSLLLT
jgi:DNA repair protein RecO (recombination protein O)